MEDSSNKVELVVQPGQAAMHLDEFLAVMLKDYSKHLLRELIGCGSVRVNSRVEIPAHVLAAGDTVGVVLPEDDSVTLKGRPVELDVIFEDGHILVLNKKAGVSVLADRGERGVSGDEACLHDGLLHYFFSNSPANGPFVKPRMVHRLDRETSGVLVVGKTLGAMTGLTRQFEEHSVCKTYLGIVDGRPVSAGGMIDLPIGEDPKRKGRMKVGENGKPAQTKFETLEEFEGYTLLALHPLSGRTHQIRVHLAELRHPLCVDSLYGRRKEMFLSQFKRGYKLKEGETERPLMSRLALHALELEFSHPVSGERVKFKSEPPKDFAVLLRMLRKYRPRREDREQWDGRG
jgi:23S rRNA pseudouridine1911/1915/1917 synthase